jgi:phage gpG-like protein
LTAEEAGRRIEDYIDQIKRKALIVIEAEALKSVRTNFEQGGRPKWIPSRKSGKTKGTKTLVVSGNLSNIGSEIDIAGSKVTLMPNPLARVYARIQHEGGTISMKPRTMARRTKKDGRSVFASKNRELKRAKQIDVSFSKAYTIKIPARPYLIIPPEDYPRIVESVIRAVEK